MLSFSTLSFFCLAWMPNSPHHLLKSSFSFPSLVHSLCQNTSLINSIKRLLKFCSQLPFGLMQMLLKQESLFLSIPVSIPSTRTQASWTPERFLKFISYLSTGWADITAECNSFEMSFSVSVIPFLGFPTPQSILWCYIV